MVHYKTYKEILEAHKYFKKKKKTLKTNNIKIPIKESSFAGEEGPYIWFYNSESMEL